MNIEFPERFNLADYFLYHNLDEGRENKTCLYFQEQTFTYGDVARMSNRVGNVLRDLGLDTDGDRPGRACARSYQWPSIPRSRPSSSSS